RDDRRRSEVVACLLLPGQRRQLVVSFSFVFVSFWKNLSSTTTFICSISSRNARRLEKRFRSEGWTLMVSGAKCGLPPRMTAPHKTLIRRGRCALRYGFPHDSNERLHDAHLVRF